MKATFTDGFRQQAVEKALLRGPEVTLNTLADQWGVGRSTLQNWIRQSRANGSVEGNGKAMKTPQIWTAADKLEVVIACDGKDAEDLSTYCREKGLYPHQVAQWKSEFVQKSPTREGGETKQLKGQLKTLKRELRRKEKALAETAALLVLQKKVDAMWSNDEDD